MHTACEPRTAYGHSPYGGSVRTKTADFVAYSSALVPIVRMNTANTACFRGRLRGSIPLGSTIKRLVRRGSGKASGQKPKMYGHAHRIDRQDKGLGKVPKLLDCCLFGAYSCPMTTSENTQRDELAQLVMMIEVNPDLLDYRHGDYSSGAVCLGDAERIADKALTAGYRKPRTITTVEELATLSRGAVVVSPFWTDAYSYIGGEDSPTKLQNVTTGAYVSVSEFDDFLPATVVHEFAWAK